MASFVPPYPDFPISLTLYTNMNTKLMFCWDKVAPFGILVAVFAHVVLRNPSEVTNFGPSIAFQGIECKWKFQYAYNTIFTKLNNI